MTTEQAHTLPSGIEALPLDLPPHRFASWEAVRVWHIRHVIPDCATFAEAAHRLGITRNQLRHLRQKHGITETPYNDFMVDRRSPSYPS